LWDYVLLRASTPVTKMASELSKSEFNKIIENLCRMSFDTDGRTVFKEEFVTAGGIQLDQVNPKSMEIKSVPGLYAVGEVLDIDGVTGGFNFQAAWTTAAVAANALSN
jgi:predicted flavoprotein YhiN